jgi:rubrerythrin
MDARAVVIDTIKRAYQVEVDGYTFYAMTADRAEKPSVRELFARLANDEVQHQALLRDVLRLYDQSGVGAFPYVNRAPDMRAFSDKVFTERFRQQAEGATFELAVLSVGMTLESNAIACYSAAVQQAAEPEVRQFYEFLLEWEQRHFDALDALYRTIRADFWDKSDLSPLA